MNQLYLQKNLPDSWQFLIRPMLLISLGLHGLLLVMPIPAEKKAEILKKEEKVKISQLAPPSPKSALQPALKPSPIASQPVVRPTTPAIRQQPVPQLVRQPLQPPKPKLTSTPQAQQKPTPQPSQLPSPAPSQQSASDPFAEFPRYPNAKQGSGGVLKPAYEQGGYVFNAAEGLEQVAANFEKLLKDKGFTSSATPTEGTFKVYQVSKGNVAPQFLHLITQEGKTVMLLAPQPYTLEALKNSQVEQQTAEERAFGATLDQVDEELSSNGSSTDDVAEPEKFSGILKSTRSEVLLSKKSLKELVSYLQDKFQENGFMVLEKGKYGGGPLYMVTKGNFTSYISLVPTKDGQRTAIFNISKPSSIEKQ